jgi:predicted TIM-barrel fold metal-dependent hydrolase
VVDAHLHLWDPARLAIGWLEDVPRLNRPIRHDEYAAAARPIGIDRAVIVEAAVDDAAVDEEVRWLHELVAAEGLVAAGVAGWRPAGDTGRTIAWLDRLEGLPEIVGVREVLHPASVGSAAPALASRIEACVHAGERGLVVDLCARPDQLGSVETLVAAASGTTFVLDHLGRPDAAKALDPDWRMAIARIARHANVHVKISALIECAAGASWTAAGFRPFVSAVLGEFGCDRAMWGSNWPVCVDGISGLAGWFEATLACLDGQSPEGREAVLGGTARRVYGLSSD